mgnify:CR=1 FL=1
MGNTKRSDRKQQLKRYGISIEEYCALLSAQGGGCAICGLNPNEEGRKLSTDHDHVSGRVRGILCTRCNSGIGMFRDRPDLLALAIRYLTNARAE